MGDMGEAFNAMRNMRRERRAKYGIPCPTCTIQRPKGNPTIMLPQQRCKVCGYRDPRPRLPFEQAYPNCEKIEQP
jgi:hypothetical protein